MGRIFIVATPIGNLSDISQRVLSTLSEVKLIAAEDTRRTKKLLNHFEINTPVVSYYKYNEGERGSRIIRRIIDEDIDVAVVSDAGTPCISDPGSVIVKMAREENIEVIPIPGPSAVITALSVSGFEFVAFSFLGFIPREKKEREDVFNSIVKSDINTFVLFESPNRIIKTMRHMEEILGDWKIFVVNDLTKYYERSYRGSIKDVAESLENQEKTDLGEYTIVLHTDKIRENVERTEEDAWERGDFSYEALLLDEIIKNSCTMKDAVEIVSEKYKINKKDVYKASVNLKNMRE